jgi:hypothetical protein
MSYLSNVLRAVDYMERNLACPVSVGVRCRVGSGMFDFSFCAIVQSAHWIYTGQPQVHHIRRYVSQRYFGQSGIDFIQ